MARVPGAPDVRRFLTATPGPTEHQPFDDVRGHVCENHAPSPTRSSSFTLSPTRPTCTSTGMSRPSSTAESMTRANAWWLAESALLAYWNAQEAVARFKRAGLTAELIERGDTQAYVAMNDKVILVAFRGTQPGSIGDIVSDVRVPLVKWTHGNVHLGFKDALELVWPLIVPKLEAAGSRSSGSRATAWEPHWRRWRPTGFRRRRVFARLARAACRRPIVRRHLRCPLWRSGVEICQRRRHRHPRANTIPAALQPRSEHFDKSRREEPSPRKHRRWRTSSPTSSGTSHPCAK